MAALCLLALFCLSLPALAAGPNANPSAKAQALRAENSYVPYAPPQSFLDGGFVADEQTATRVFGPIKQFAVSRACPTAWLIDQAEKERLARLAAQPDQPDMPKRPDQPNVIIPAEYSVVLEEDCGAKVTHRTFVVWPGESAKDWLAWRKRFHGGKADNYYGPAVARLEKASQDGVRLSGELRFVTVNGEISTARAEDALLADPKVHAVYDLTSGKRLGK